MILKVVHTTEYIFKEPVFLEPHILRFHPRNDFRQQILEYALAIDPQPSGRNEWLDENGNIVESCWYSAMIGTFSLQATSIVEMKESKPFNFLVHPDNYLHLPVRSTKSPSLQPYLTMDEQNSDIDDIYFELVKKSAGNSLDFLIASTAYLHSGIERIERETGDALKPSQTLMQKSGSCRDISVLHMELIRKAGIPARFVSGYLYISGNEQNHELHAWVEAFLGGAGWIGFDATTGLAVIHNHMAVATGSLQSETLPVIGTYRGQASSDIKTNVEVSELTEYRR